MNLHRYIRELERLERERLEEGGERFEDLEEVVRRDGEAISIDVLDGLMEHTRKLAAAGEWSSPETSDRWLAPRLHNALRLRRSEAGDKGLWHWVALRYPTYVAYRWDGLKGITRDRWFGPIQKQAFARLWWGAELFRDGPDYGPVDFFFQRQDMPNSYLHRPLVRCRPLALGLVDQLRDVNEKSQPKASQINDLARALNLTTAGISPEAETYFARDDISQYEDWLAEDAIAGSWTSTPSGPKTGTRSELVSEAGRAIAARGWGIAPQVATARNSRGSGGADSDG
jgi:hypothetical protein